MADIFGLKNANVATDANIDGKKVMGKYDLGHSQGSTIVAAKEYLRIVAGTTGTLLSFEAAITETIATGADRTVTVDLKKSTGGGAFATVLSSTIGFTNGSTLLVATAASFSNISVTDGDILAIVVTVAGSAGAQAVGLVATLTMMESAT